MTPHGITHYIVIRVHHPVTHTVPVLGQGAGFPPGTDCPGFLKFKIYLKASIFEISDSLTLEDIKVYLHFATSAYQVKPTYWAWGIV
jgi:hypothetical protein